MEKALYSIFGVIIQIDAVILLLSGLAFIFLMCNAFKYAKRILAMAIFLLILTVISPLPFWLATYLENYYPAVDKIPDDTKGIILLGGSFDRGLMADRETVVYNLAASRFTEGALLARANPHLKLLFTGGGRPLNGVGSEAKIAREQLKRFGLDLQQILFEESSLDTRANATTSLAIAKPAPTDKWLLVTSAIHMPRAVGLFRKAGWKIVPYPVDYHTRKNYEWSFNLNMAKGLLMWSAALREWCGMINNMLFGYSDQLLPIR